MKAGGGGGGEVVAVVYVTFPPPAAASTLQLGWFVKRREALKPLLVGSALQDGVDPQPSTE